VLNSASVIAELLRLDLVDDLRLALVLVLVGGGLRLFPDGVAACFHTTGVTALEHGAVGLHLNETKPPDNAASQPRTARFRVREEHFPDVTSAPAPAGKHASGSTPPRRSPRTTTGSPAHLIATAAFACQQQVRARADEYRFARRAALPAGNGGAGATSKQQRGGVVVR
jgi:hypothetical protein